MTFRERVAAPLAVAEFGVYALRTGVAKALGRIAMAGDAALDCWDGQTDDSRAYNRYLNITPEAPAATEAELDV